MSFPRKSIGGTLSSKAPELSKTNEPSQAGSSRRQPMDGSQVVVEYLMKFSQAYKDFANARDCVIKPMALFGFAKES